MFSTLSKRAIVILATHDLSSANAFNLVPSKSLSFGKGLRSLSKDVLKTMVEKESLKDQIFDLCKFKAFANDRLCTDGLNHGLYT